MTAMRGCKHCEALLGRVGRLEAALLVVSRLVLQGRDYPGPVGRAILQNFIKKLDDNP